MTDIEFIQEYLEKNYSVRLNNTDYSFYDLISKKSHSVAVFMSLFKTIFTEFEVGGGKTSLDLAVDWFDSKKEVLVADLMKIMKSLDLSEGSVICISHLKYRHKLLDETKYSFYFVETTFNDYYKTHNLNKRLVEFGKRLDEAELDVELIYGELLYEMSRETDKIHEYSLDYIGTEVFDKYIDGKLQELFSEFVITLGRFNWMVTWIGHGILTEQKLLNQFSKFGERYTPRILNRYDNWYSESVIAASDRHLGKQVDQDTPRFVPSDHELTPFTVPESYKAVPNPDTTPLIDPTPRFGAENPPLFNNVPRIDE